ncbi:MAG: hypothetical protein CVU38_09250 [Chloroflexi bacterium HGW-Chloroflexi-1]|nr:MAG: hypothetical protein CVU38_09250 [Chloroflexi bacterium HGW-Chloroflexi-1]
MICDAPAPRWRRLMWGTDRSRHLAGLVALGLVAIYLARAPLVRSVAALVGATTTALILASPATGLAVLALLIPLGGLVPLPAPGIDAVDLLVALILAGWLMQSIARREIRFRPPALTWPLLAFVWLAALSLTQATSWREGLPEWLKWAEFAALYFVATQVLDRRRAWWVIGGLFAAGVIEAGLGAYQFLRQVGPEPFILMGRFMRAYGTFRQPNPYAGYLGYLTPVAASLALGGLGRWWQTRHRVDLVMGLTCGGAALALAVGIGMSWSRGGWLGLLIGLLVVAGLRNRRTAFLTLSVVLLLVAVIALVGTAWLPSAITGRLNDPGGCVVGPGSGQPDPARTEITDANFSVLERLAHWQAGLGMFADHPWLGVGIGNYGVVYATYALPHWYEPLGHAHNVYINFLAETGALGASAFGLFWLGMAWYAWRSATRSDGNRAALAIGLLGTLAYLSVHSLFDNLFVQHMQLQLALLLGSLVALRSG